VRVNRHPTGVNKSLSGLQKTLAFVNWNLPGQALRTEDARECKEDRTGTEPAPLLPFNVRLQLRVTFGVSRCEPVLEGFVLSINC